MAPSAGAEYCSPAGGKKGDDLWWGASGWTILVNTCQFDKVLLPPVISEKSRNQEVLSDDGRGINEDEELKCFAQCC